MRPSTLPVLFVLLAGLPTRGGEAPREEKSVPDNLILLRNEHLEVGVFPQLGGRVVSLKRTGGQNVLLDRHADLLDAPEERLPKPSPNGTWPAKGTSSGSVRRKTGGGTRT